MIASSALIAAFLSTGFISLAPNLILFAFPGYGKEGAAEGSVILSMGQTLAAGGLLGDVFLHTIPHACHEDAGLWVLVGFLIFLIMDMIIRSIDDQHDHHNHDPKMTQTDQSNVRKEWTLSKVFSSGILLNLTADALHNFTDGLAIGASFAVSGVDHASWTSLLASRGGLATLSILFHEIPHELGDYCILLKNGMTKMEAIATQFFTAIAAFIGTAIGLWAASTWPGVNLITAGGFVYLATVTILPSVLEERKTSLMFRLCQLAAFLLGVGFLYSVSLMEGDHGHGHAHHHHDHVLDSQLKHEEQALQLHDHHGNDHDDSHHDHHHHSHGHEL